MLVDDVTIRLEGGHGGRGAVAFSAVPRTLGPTGANGGRGGSVFFEGVADLGALIQFTSKKDIAAENGQLGQRALNDGHAGADLILKIPVGTTITNLDTGSVLEISHTGERFLAVAGGLGGRGNYKFRSSTNTTPMEFQPGLAGDVANFRLELKLSADVGLIGLPNAGKSSLLNELTGAHSKVAHYAFTTLEAHLGVYYEIVIADIPGLIEGASSGKGLGVKFLKHVERTGTLFHLVSAESDDVVRDYKVIRNELEGYAEISKKRSDYRNPSAVAEPAANKMLNEKTEYVFLTKSDMVTPADLKAQIAAFKKLKIKAIPLSILDPESMDAVKKILNDIKAAK